MLSLLWRNLRWRKGRLALLILGAAVLSTGLAYLAVLSDSMRTEVDTTLQQHWQTSYDLLVRPAGSSGPIEQRDQLVEANFLSGQKRGITQAQVDAIRSIPGVDIAAPEAVLGHVSLQTNLDMEPPKEPGLYRVNTTVTSFDGVRTFTARATRYQVYYPYPLTAQARTYLEEQDLWRNMAETFGVNSMFVISPTNEGTRGPFYNRSMLSYPVLLAAVDPAAEAQLVGLDKAVVDGRYLAAGDTAAVDPTRKLHVTKVPVLMSTQPVSQLNLQMEYQQVMPGYVSPDDLMKALQQGQLNLQKLTGTPAGTYQLHDKELVNRLKATLTANDPRSTTAAPIYVQPSPLSYQEVQSPSPDWPLTLKVVPTGQARSTYYLGSGGTQETPRVAYRPTGGAEGPIMIFQLVGQYEPGRLTNVGGDAANAVPVETYRPIADTLRFDQNGQPVAPTVIRPGENPQDAFLSPPILLTTLDAAKELLKTDAVISAVRVRVAGTQDLSEASQARVQWVADEIERQTGLQVDITLGSSPRRLLVQVPGLDGIPGLGYVEQPWVQKGAQILIHREFNKGDALLLLLVLVVGIIYVLATSMVSVLSRRRDLALMSATGWSPGAIFGSIVAEMGLSAVATALVGILVAYLVGLIGKLYMPLERILLTGVSTAVVYLIGTLGPALLAGRTQPMTLLRQGETGKVTTGMRVRSILGLAAVNSLSRWRRNLVSLFAIGVPTALMAVLVFITVRFKGILFLTVVGQAIVLQIGRTQLIALAVGFALAILTTADVLWLNTLERSSELALLSALGWRRKTVRASILVEGALIGAIAGFIGLSAGLGVMAAYFRSPVLPLIPVAVVLLAVPTLMGALGAILPAEVAIRIQPSDGLRTE